MTNLTVDYSADDRLTALGRGDPAARLGHASEQLFIVGAELAYARAAAELAPVDQEGQRRRPAAGVLEHPSHDAQVSRSMSE